MTRICSGHKVSDLVLTVLLDIIVQDLVCVLIDEMV